MDDALGGPGLAWYVLDGRAVRLDPDRGPLTEAGDRVDCVAWMDRAVSVSREEYLAVANARASKPSRPEPIGPM
jgi:hypothetical protein